MNPRGLWPGLRSFGRVLARLGVAMLSALLLGAHASWAWLFPLTYVALVPWVVLYTRNDHPRVSAGYYVVSVWVAWLLCHLLVFRFGWLAAIATTTILFVFWTPFALILRGIHHRFHFPRAVTVPIVWVGLEWVRAQFTLGHLDFFGLGYSQAFLTPLIQFADVTGVYGVSFLIAAVNGFLADVLIAWKENGWSLRRLMRTRRVVLTGAAVAIAFTIVASYGIVRISRARYLMGPRLAIVQPNVTRGPSNIVGPHLEQLLMTDRSVPPGEVDLIVWPENSILDNLFRPGAYLEDLRWQASRKDAWMLVGATGKPAAHPGKVTNTAFLLDNAGTVVERYDKQVLFPWTEYIPLDRFLGRLSPTLRATQRSIVRAAWGSLSPGVAGDRTVLMLLPWKKTSIPFAALICLENSFAPIPAKARRLGARFFVNITSEGAVGGSMQEQLLRISMLRAVENRVSYVRVGNTGVSCFIDPCGRLQSLLRGERGGTVFDKGVLIDRILLSQDEATLYARSRDAFAKACVAAAALMWGWSWSPRSHRERRRRRQTEEPEVGRERIA